MSNEPYNTSDILIDSSRDIPYLSIDFRNPDITYTKRIIDKKKIPTRTCYYEDWIDFKRVNNEREFELQLDKLPKCAHLLTNFVIYIDCDTINDLDGIFFNFTDVLEYDSLAVTSHLEPTDLRSYRYKFNFSKLYFHYSDTMLDKSYNLFFKIQNAISPFLKKITLNLGYVQLGELQYVKHATLRHEDLVHYPYHIILSGKMELKVDLPIIEIIAENEVRLNDDITLCKHSNVTSFKNPTYDSYGEYLYPEYITLEGKGKVTILFMTILRRRKHDKMPVIETYVPPIYRDHGLVKIITK